MTTNPKTHNVRAVLHKNLPDRWWEDRPVVPLLDYENDAEYPREFFANLEYRSDIINMAASDPKIADELWIKCSRDILFYVNTFCYTFDPRLITSTPEQPFITYPFQDMAILRLQKAVFDGEDILIEKSRDMGATWMCLIVIQWFFLFKDMSTFMVVSRKEDLVDRSEDPDSLMWKMDFMTDRFPSWLTPLIYRIKVHIGNKDNGATVDGEASTGDPGRGGRRTAMLLDEYPKMRDGEGVSKATADVTNCRFFIGTPEGMGNDFYTKRQSGMQVLTLHWSLHPDKAKGCYIGTDKKLHSPWYDKECKRRSRIDIAQELDIAYRASDAQFFDGSIVKELKEQSRDPYATGELNFDDEMIDEFEFMPRENGHLKLWFHPDMRGNPPNDRTYIVSADVSTGSGSSDSVLSVMDEKTQEKVAMWKDNHTDQPTLAKICVALARWFKGPDDEPAFTIWEANGPGFLFGKKLIEEGHFNIYYDKSEKEINGKRSMRPGFYSTIEKKLLFLGDYRNALESGLYINHSKESLDQCDFYVYMNGTVTHSQSEGNNDPTKNKFNHGDDVIADALGWKAFVFRNDNTDKKAKNKGIKKKPEPGSFAHRRDDNEKLGKKESAWL